MDKDSYNFLMAMDKGRRVRLIPKFISNYNAFVELNISLINGIFKALFRLEKLVIPNFSLPFGLSIVVAAVKRSDI